MNEGAGSSSDAERSPRSQVRPEGDRFVPSALGTREHWDAVYRELQTFQEYGDTGEIWFGEESVMPTNKVDAETQDSIGCFSA